MDRTYEAILFDFDGVLVDSEPLHYACWRDVLAPLGIPFDFDYYNAHYIGISDRKVIEDAVARAGGTMSVDEVFAHFPRKTELFRERVRRELPFVPGVHALFDDLRDYRLGVVSSSQRAEVAPVLEAVGLLDRLQVTVFGNDVTRHKPDPEPYRMAAERLGVTRALVVEDSDAGVESGRAAGFDVLRIPQPQEMVALLRGRLGVGTA
jgi:beta-phosphoglucomutase